MIEAAVTSRLRTDAQLAAAVGRRVFPILAAIGQPLPYIVYQRIDSEHVRSFAGVTGLARVRLQLDVYAETYRQSKDIAERVRLAMDGFSGQAAGMRVQGVSLESTNDVPVVPQSAKEQPVYRVSMDFNVWHDEARA